MEEKIEVDDLVLFPKKNCKICGKPTDGDICVVCLQTYVPKVKAFLDVHPGLCYLEAVGHKNLPIPRKAFYELTEAGIIKVKE